MLATGLSLLFGFNLNSTVCAAVQETDDERAIVEKILGTKKIPKEEMLLWLVFLNEIEGNYSTFLRLEELQKYYEEHKSNKTPYRKGWCAAKLAHFYFLKGYKQKAAAQCTVALSLLKKMPDPARPDATFFYRKGLEALYPVLYKLRKFKEGIDTKVAYDDAVRYLGKPESRIYGWFGIDAYLRGDNKEALGYCDESQKADPKYCYPHFLRAMVQLEEDHSERARTELYRALQKSPFFPSAYVFLAFVELRQEHRDAAKKWLERSLSQEPNELAYFISGILKAQDKDYVGAADYLEKAEAEIQYWFVNAARGECLLELRRFDEAVKEFTSAINRAEKKDSKTRAILYFERAVATENGGDKEKALPDLDKAIELDPSNKELFKQRGVLRLALGDQKGTSDYDEYSRLVLADENSSISSKEGRQNVVTGQIIKAKQRKGTATVAAKPSWISGEASASKESAAESSSDDKDKRTDFEKKITDAVAASTKGGASAGKPAALRDPYLIYFENKLLQVGLRKPGLETVKGTVKVESDGVPIVDSQPLLKDLVNRAASFKPLPEGHSELVVEFSPSDGTVKVEFPAP